MTQPFEKQLSVIASFLDALRAREDAKLEYDLMSDGLWWTDERPEQLHRIGEVRLAWAMRPLFRYRTSLIVEEPDLRYQDLWNQACGLFPNWPGFLPQRCRPDANLASYYNQARGVAENSVERHVN